MSAVHWNCTVVDSPGYQPYAVVGDLVLAVRTPRSRDFVTVEVATMAECGGELVPAGAARPIPTPTPRLHHQWQGEVGVGHTVPFELHGARYHLTLARLEEGPDGFPWVACDFCLERD
jgi:hypothetical protein